MTLTRGALSAVTEREGEGFGLKDIPQNIKCYLFLSDECFTCDFLVKRC